MKVSILLTVFTLASAVAARNHVNPKSIKRCPAAATRGAAKHHSKPRLLAKRSCESECEDEYACNFPDDDEGLAIFCFEWCNDRSIS